MSILFFQAEDGIRDDKVTGVQTCALPISQAAPEARGDRRRGVASAAGSVLRSLAMAILESVRWSPDGDAVRIIDQTQLRSEERRVGKEGRYLLWLDQFEGEIESRSDMMSC